MEVLGTGPNPEELPGEDGQKRDSALRPGRAGGGTRDDQNAEGDDSTIGTEEKTRKHPRTAHEQEDTEATNRHLKEGRTRRQCSKTPATLWEERGLHSVYTVGFWGLPGKERGKDKHPQD
ncbi:hypothetical protein NDU88_001317 [Pleurodeles waltl]|uniref:Uncharacterized protein n=1 Tax=Pleurodeles waltl TaxID=8319 RepID=A0AAV7WLK6_PLEWA|nr:hypothetical protein NDU88_001317 [Pleurodeles waltl]